MNTQKRDQPKGLLHQLNTPVLLLVASGLLILCLLTVASPSLRFVRGVFTGSLHPLDQFDSGETLEFEDPQPYSNYLLAMEVDERHQAVPEMQVNIHTSTGEEPITRPINRWNSVMGREYTQFLIIESPIDGKLTITIETEQNQDFLIYREINDVLEHELKRVTPFWIGGIILLVLSVILFSIALMRLIRQSEQLDLQI